MLDEEAPRDEIPGIAVDDVFPVKPGLLLGHCKQGLEEFQEKYKPRNVYAPQKLSNPPFHLYQVSQRIALRCANSTAITHLIQELRNYIIASFNLTAEQW